MTRASRAERREESGPALVPSLFGGVRRVTPRGLNSLSDDGPGGAEACSHLNEPTPARAPTKTAGSKTHAPARIVPRRPLSVEAGKRGQLRASGTPPRTDAAALA
jgi:hypothetical protein